MQAKMFEVRDRMTFIPVMAVRLDPASESDRYLLARAGYGTQPHQQAEYILLCEVNGGAGQCACDPFEWRSRTMRTAHEWIVNNFDSPPGTVVDVEYILGVTPEPKRSEALVAHE